MSILAAEVGYKYKSTHSVSFMYMVWGEVCNRASRNIIRKKAIQVTGTKTEAIEEKKLKAYWARTGKKCL